MAETPPAAGISPLGRVAELAAPWKLSLSLTLLGILVSAPMTHLHPLLWQQLVDKGIVGKDPSVVLPLVVLMFATHIGGTALLTLTSYSSHRVGMRMMAVLRRQLHEKLCRQSLAWFHDRSTGDLMARITADVDNVQALVTTLVGTLAARVMGALFMLGAMVWISPGLAVWGTIPLVLVAVSVRVYNRLATPIYRDVRDRFGDVSGRLSEDLQGIQVIKAFAREAEATGAFDLVQEAHTEATLKSLLVSSLYGPTLAGLTFGSNMVFLVVGIRMIMRSELTLGELLAFRGYLWSLMSEMNALTSVNEGIQRSLAGVARVLEVLDAPEAVADAPDAREPGLVRGAIRFEGLAFGYRPDRVVLQGIDLEVPAGSSLAVVGPSGAGKSTLIGLLLRFFDPLAGRVLIDGQDLRKLVQRSYRRNLGVVNQEPFLFSGTIRENLLLANPGAGAAELERVLSQANAADFVRQLPEKLETRVGERGVKLSVGQKQRLCVARAFLADPRILLLDEATASVEQESEALIQDAIAKLMEGRTAVIVTHRMSMARPADRIVVIDQGGIAESGTHAELLARGGWYARMTSLQLTGERPAAVAG